MAIRLEKPIHVTRRRPRNDGNRGSPRIAEGQPSVGLLDGVAALVHEAVMAPAQEHEIRDLRLASARPVADVVRVEETAVLAAWEATTAVARLQGSAHRRRNRARLSADRQRFARAFPDLDDRGVAGEPPRRLLRERRTVLERADAVPARECGVVDVDDQLITLAARAPVAPAGERELGHRAQRLGIRGSPRRPSRFRGTALVLPGALLQQVARNLERPQEEGTVLGSKPGPDDERAVLVPAVADVGRVLERVRLVCRHPAVGANGALELSSGQVARELEQLLLGVCVRDARERSHLGV